jgi:hypothetical protein
MSFIQIIHPCPRFTELFRNRLIFYGEGLLAPCPIPLKLEDHPLSALHDCFANVFAATSKAGGPFLHLKPEDMPCCGDKGPTYQFHATHI